MKNKLSKLNCIEEENGYGSCQNCPCVEDCDLDNECEDNEWFDIGFRKGHQVACEELMGDIYINGYKIDRIDDIKQKVITLGNCIPFEYRKVIDEILEELSGLMKDVAFEAIEEYLGYR